MATATATRLTEKIAAGGRVDRAAGVIRDVRILGRSSKNGRTYSREALAQAADKYEGVAVFCNHDEREGDRDVRDKIGWLENVRLERDALRGDLHLLLSHPVTAQILETAERRPTLLGLSHAAYGSVVPGPDGGDVVESIEGVDSVDIVSRPATNTGLFESVDSLPDDTDLLADPRQFKTDLIARGDEVVLERLQTSLLAIIDQSDSSDLMGTLGRLARAVELAVEVVQDPTTVIVDDQRDGPVLESERALLARGVDPEQRRQYLEMCRRSRQSPPRCQLSLAEVASGVTLAGKQRLQELLHGRGYESSAALAESLCERHRAPGR